MAALRRRGQHEESEYSGVTSCQQYREVDTQKECPKYKAQEKRGQQCLTLVKVGDHQRSGGPLSIYGLENLSLVPVPPAVPQKGLGIIKTTHKN